MISLSAHHFTWKTLDVGSIFDGRCSDILIFLSELDAFSGVNSSEKPIWRSALVGGMYVEIILLFVDPHQSIVVSFHCHCHATTVDNNVRRNQSRQFCKAGMVALIMAAKESQTTARVRRRKETRKSTRKTRNPAPASHSL